MKHTRVTALAAIGLVATLSLTACNSGDTAQGSTSPSTGASADSGSGGGGDNAQQGSGSGGGSQAGGAKNGSGTGSGSGSGSGKASAQPAGSNGGGSTKVTFCKTSDLAIDAVDASPGSTEGRINITMVNRGSTTCSATGFAGVDITDADHTSNPIERGPAQPRVTTLKPGAAAVFNLAYAVDNSGNSLSHPTELIVTPPNETHHVTLKWPAGAPGIKGAYTDVQVYPTHTTE
jgi:hypothetical protein